MKKFKLYQKEELFSQPMMFQYENIIKTLLEESLRNILLKIPI